MSEEKQENVLQYITIPIESHVPEHRKMSTPQAQKNMSESEIWEQYTLVKAQSWHVLRMLSES